MAMDDPSQATNNQGQSPNAETPADADVVRVEQDRKLAADLLKRGVAPAEVERLLGLGKPAKPEPPVGTAPAEGSPHTFVLAPSIELPAPHESSPEERTEADRKVSAAFVARRRGAFAEAEKLVAEAVRLCPMDGSALELYGDVLQELGRVDDAIYCYERAMSTGSGRATAGRKHAELLLLQDREIEALRDQHVQVNPTVAVLLSAVLPGAGQIYNGEAAKGLVVALILLISVIVLLWTPFGIPGSMGGLTPSVVVCLLVLSAAYIYAAVDANVSCRSRTRKKSGWDV